MGRVHHKYKQPVKPKSDPTADYCKFDELNGLHSWQKSVPEGYLLYPVRKLNQGQIVYFNYDLAKEMGLIAKSHSHKMNKSLEKKLLDTFSLRIINEYDETQNIKYHPTVMKSKPYMATRYLQLQHKNKSGKTSGDGRSIWNGEVHHNNTVWDVSSRGTGVTRLAPGAVEANKPLRSGSTSFGYGCGLADLDELVASAIMAEIFHKNNIQTERVLCVIDLGRGSGIGVRAGKNLFRPAHLFMHLKQSDYSALTKATDYLINRQCKNNEWTFNSQNKNKYTLMLQELSESFAHFAAQLDREYIFAWLDWDGDNVLANAGIIDYGSIRQFGLRHDEYRYDDVDRFSTTLAEQKNKARQIVQVFAQLTDYLAHGLKKNIQSFHSHWSLRQFDEHFQYYLHDKFLKQIGLNRRQREQMLSGQLKLVRKLFRSYSNLERTKTRRKKIKLVDGVNRPAIFNMRSILYELPQYLIHTFEAGVPEALPPETFFNLILADTARGRDRRLSNGTCQKIILFQKFYLELIMSSLSGNSPISYLEKISEAALNNNPPDRLTGDALLNIVDEILKFKKSENKEIATIQVAIDQLITNQSPKSVLQNEELRPHLHASRRAKSLYDSILTLIDGFRESI